ncbi:major facilitator superfamily domain-containing protein [Boeremia exigua]|uniref:major facilitator superfamily domain-containing protein n=1 Tax=Boeremia exigua TaxID=749465 RepID=UPI001E8E0CDA|nr:major facilitator superfamily domain-containing protein [Boeremia exigua]KAH6621950.1 major facilitator superfamily domain-containing protein [Boeremia exigua]
MTNSSSDDEYKPGTVHQEKFDTPPAHYDTDTDGIEEKRLVRKIDWRLLPILGALYSISLIDRTNIANARVAGMGADLALNVGDRYTTALVMFFPTYVIFELPSNIVLRKVGSANWLAFIAVSWGAVMIGQGFVKSWQALTACRALLGLFEAGFFPGCVYLITCWYKRREMQKRLGGFYLVAVGIGGIANILAYGIMQMEGVGGVRGWQWIFILEGILTCVVAICSWFLILDFPDKAAKQGFLSESEANFVLRRIEEDRGDSENDPLTWAKATTHLGDYKLWAFCTLFMSTTVPVYAFAYFTPVILVGMGYSAGVANALSAPPAIAAMITAFGFAWIGDKYQLRAPIIAIQSVICLVGLMLVAYVENNGVRYFGVFLGIMGGQGNVPAILTYQANNIRMQSKRSVASALQIGFGGIGGILASTVFRQQDAPKYVVGLWVSAGLQFYTLAVLAATSWLFWKTNKKADEQLARGETVDPIEGQVGFRYTI